MPNFTITEHRDPMSYNQGAPWYVTSTTPDPNGDTTWGHFPTRQDAEAFVTAVNNKEQDMTTITIPRDDFVQRADDEGRDFYALRTIRAAAFLWAQQDGNGWTELGDEQDEAPVLIFAQNGATTPNVWTVREDSEMDLYPAAPLPFTIAPQRVEVGDWINTHASLPNPRRITGVREVDGAWDVDIDGRPGLILPRDQGPWKVVPAPTVTYTVTVRADHTIDDVADMLGNLGGPVEVSRS